MRKAPGRRGAAAGQAHAELPAWLEAGLHEAGEPVPLLLPYPADAMRAYPVGALVSDPRHDGPGCLTAAV
jgi:putative SOS response-associated peptidase YedK